jgi:hypothetical protein
MFAVAAIATTGAVALLASGHAWFAGSAVGLVTAVLAYAVLPTASGLVTAGALSIVLAVSTVAEFAEPTPLSVGAVLVADGALICLLAAFGPVRHRDIGAGVGALIALVGAQQPLAAADSTGWAHTLTFAVGVACFALYRQLPSAPLLAAGVVGPAVAALEVTWEVTSGPAGVAAVLGATGATLVTTGALGTHLWRRRRRWAG